VGIDITATVNGVLEKAPGAKAKMEAVQIA
jgi:hypothetical protein